MYICIDGPICFRRRVDVDRAFLCSCACLVHMLSYCQARCVRRGSRFGIHTLDMDADAGSEKEEAYLQFTAVLTPAKDLTFRSGNQSIFSCCRPS